jgi:cytoskeleton-associated protein 5
VSVLLARSLTLCSFPQVGDGKETIRNRVRAIFATFCRVYPFGKVFAAILEHGLVSKNARIRTESADELGSLFQRHGASAFPVAKALPLIAKLISDRDTAVRTAALHAIGSVYTSLGADATWKYVGRIADKERSMLEERLKRTPGGAGGGGSAGVTAASSPAPTRSATPVQRAGTPSRLQAPERTSAPPSPSPVVPAANGIPSAVPRGIAGKPGASRLARPHSAALPAHVAIETKGTSLPRKPSISGLQQPRQIARPSVAASSASQHIPSNHTSISASLLDFDDEDVHRPETPADPSALIDAMDTKDLAQLADVLKRVQVEIAAHPESLVAEADNLIDAVTLKMELGFTDLNRQSSQATLRLCKHLMQTLSSFFDHRTLGQAVSTESLTALLAELTGRLLDTAENPASDAITSLSKVLNMVLIRIFHHADQSACFRLACVSLAPRDLVLTFFCVHSALFSVLQGATCDLRDLRGQELADRAKYAELVMKVSSSRTAQLRAFRANLSLCQCLWKVSKTVKESLESRTLSAPRLLRDINQFLVMTPPAEWRRRSTDNIPLADMPLRTVKTILQQVVSVFGEQVFDELEEIDSPENSFVYQYLFRLASNPSVASTARRSSAESDVGSLRSGPLGRPSSASSVASVRREAAPSRLAAASPPLMSSPMVRGSSQQGSADSAAATAAAVASPGGADIEMNNSLKAIFDLIGDPIRSREVRSQWSVYLGVEPY